MNNPKLSDSLHTVQIYPPLFPPPHTFHTMIQQHVPTTIIVLLALVMVVLFTIYMCLKLNDSIMSFNDTVAGARAATMALNNIMPSLNNYIPPTPQSPDQGLLGPETPHMDIDPPPSIPHGDNGDDGGNGDDGDDPDIGETHADDAGAMEDTHDDPPPRTLSPIVEDPQTEDMMGIS